MEKILEFIKLSPKYLFGVAVVTGILLFSTNEFLTSLGLILFLEEYRKYVGIVFLVSLCFTVNHIIFSGFDIVINFFGYWIDMKLGKKKLRELTIEEKKILDFYIKNGTKTQKLSYANGTVNELEHYKIIHRSSDVGRMLIFHYNIQPWAWDYLMKHRYLLDIPVDEAEVY